MTVLLKTGLESADALERPSAVIGALGVQMSEGKDVSKIRIVVLVGLWC